MKLEDQVAPLALAQRMKELGFPQETVFVWVMRGVPVPGVTPWGDPPPHQPDVQLSHEDDTPVICAAPTVAEMGEWLPDKLGVGSWASSGRYFCGEDDSETTIGATVAATEAEARAKMLILLATSITGTRRYLRVTLVEGIRS